jgi:hypothetical protein
MGAASRDRARAEAPRLYQGCSGKRKFGDQASAEAAAERLAAVRGFATIYQCKWCHCWHVTTQPRRER